MLAPQACKFVWGIAIYIFLRVIIVINSINSILDLILYRLTVALKCFVGLERGLTLKFLVFWFVIINSVLFKTFNVLVGSSGTSKVVVLQDL